MRIARWVSILAHPFAMVSLMVGTAASVRQTRADVWKSVAVVVLFTIVPIALLMARQVRRGAWENADASNRSERPILYVVGGLALAVLLLYLTALRTQSFMVRGVIATLGMVGACAVAMPWIKVSLHMAFAALCGTTLALMGSPVGYAIAVSLPLIAWARLTLKRHTPAELMLGSVAGMTSGAAIHYL